MFGIFNKKKNLVVDRIVGIAQLLYDRCDELDDIIYTMTSKRNNVLVKLEFYIYLHDLVDTILKINKVNKEYRDETYRLILSALFTTKYWKDLFKYINEKELEKLLSIRTDFYTDLFSNCKDLNEVYIMKLIDYQSKLIIYLVKYDTIYNINSDNNRKCSIENRDITFNTNIKNILTEYYINVFIGFIGQLKNNLNNDYFSDEDYKHR